MTAKYDGAGHMLRHSRTSGPQTLRPGVIRLISSSALLLITKGGRKGAKAMMKAETKKKLKLRKES